MSEEPENIILGYIIALRNDLAESKSEMRADFLDLKVRMTAAVQNLATINNRLDRMDIRLEHIEKRLDLAAAH